MGDIAIRVEGLSKQYRIGKKQQAHTSLRDALSDSIAAPFRRARSLMQGQAYGATEAEEIIWALKDVSFEVKRGEVIGEDGRGSRRRSNSVVRES